MTEFTLQSVGKSLALASRLIPRTSFKTSSSKSSLVSALMAAEALAPGLIILMGPPSSFPGDGTTSVNDAWRTSLFHVTVIASWNWNATKAEKLGQYRLASKAADNLRSITPDAAYLVSRIRFNFNVILRCRVVRTRQMFMNRIMKVVLLVFACHSVDRIFLVAFWGNHYNKLLEIKRK